MCCFWWSVGVIYTSASVAKGFNHALVSVAVNLAPALIEEKKMPLHHLSVEVQDAPALVITGSINSLGASGQ